MWAAEHDPPLQQSSGTLQASPGMAQQMAVSVQTRPPLHVMPHAPQFGLLVNRRTRHRSKSARK
jgi:hypothetical protein